MTLPALGTHRRPGDDFEMILDDGNQPDVDLLDDSTAPSYAYVGSVPVLRAVWFAGVRSMPAQGTGR